MNTNKKINIKICNKAKNITSVVMMIAKTKIIYYIIKCNTLGSVDIYGSSILSSTCLFMKQMRNVVVFSIYNHEDKLIQKISSKSSSKQVSWGIYLLFSLQKLSTTLEIIEFSSSEDIRKYISLYVELPIKSHSLTILLLN